MISAILSVVCTTAALECHRLYCPLRFEYFSTGAGARRGCGVFAPGADSAADQQAAGGGEVLLHSSGDGPAAVAGFPGAMPIG